MQVDRANAMVGEKEQRSVGIKANDLELILTGKWLRVAALEDEEWREGDAIRPEIFVARFKDRSMADIFTFAQRIPDTKPKYLYPMEWDNAAVIPITGFRDWWDNRLSQESRRNVRLAAKRGIVVRQVEFNDELVKGIKGIYDETPVRQGRQFWHYRKDLDTVRRENATYLNRSDFVGAYYKDELVGFIKLVYVDRVGSIMQILSRNQHYDKRPANALIAKAVELCEQKGMAYLTYCKFIYSGNEKSPLTEFKRRNGFEQMMFPRYYVPLTTKGKIALSLHLHHGLRCLLPRGVATVLRLFRARFYQIVERKRLDALG